MENISLGDIYNVLGWIAGILGSGAVIARFSVNHLGKIIRKELEPIDKKIDENTRKINQVDIDNTKNYLQQTISAVNDGAKLDMAARERFYENYDHYTEDLHLNSWVHKEVKRLEKEGKL